MFRAFIFDLAEFVSIALFCGSVFVIGAILRQWAL